MGAAARPAREVSDVTYAILRWLFRLVFRVVFRWRVRGAERIPRTGPLLVCSNHISWWDPPLIGCIMPRRIYFMAKEEIFRWPVLGPLFPRFGAFPVRRGEPDRQAVRTALDHLAEGRAVGIFPEGTRSRTGELRPAQPGAALLAVRSRVPILPIAIKGPFRPFRPVYVVVGTPFELKEYYDRKVNTNDLAEAGERIMGEIARLLAEAEALADRLPRRRAR